MNLRNNLQAKILLFIISTVIIVFIVIGSYVALRNNRLAVDNAHDYTQLMAEKNAKAVKGIFDKYIGFVDAAADLYTVKFSDEKSISTQEVQYLMSNQLKRHTQINYCWTFWNEGLIDGDNSMNSVLFKASKKDKSIARKINSPSLVQNYQTKVSGNSNITVSEPYYEENRLIIDIFAPIYNNSNIVGQFGISLDLAFFDDFIENSYIYEGGFITVMSNSSIFVAHSVKDFIGKKFATNFPEDNANWDVERKIKNGKEFSFSSNFEKKSYYSYFVPFDFGNKEKAWVVEVTVPMHKVLEVSMRSLRKSAIFGVIGIIVMIFAIWFTTKRVISPIKKVTGILDLLAKGDTKSTDNLEIKTGDELQEMSDSLTKVIKGLKKTESFALEIGKGNLENEYTLLGDKDQLGMALLNMRNSLFKNKNEEEARKQEEAIRNWGTQGIAKFAEILRQDNNDMKKLGFNIMTNLINYLEVNQGALFVLNEDDQNNSDNRFYELITAIAYNRDKFVSKEIHIGEGLVGRCAYEKKTILLKDIPSNYVNITSGLGTANPNCVLIVPCILNDEVYAVIEIASFKELELHEVEFVEKLGESIGATISSVRTNEKTSKLLRASQLQSEELAAQEEEMRQNLEEMQATQEDLQRQHLVNEEMKESLTKQSALLNSLLDNIPDYIYFKDLNSKFLRISKSMLHLFGLKSVDAIVGKSDFDFRGHAEAQKYYNDEQEIINSKSGIKNQIQKEQKGDGTTQWNSVTKMPLLDGEGNCIGTFGISKDITDLKKMEIESRKKQVELEGIVESISNSTYMIQYNIEGFIIDINAAVLDLFGIDRAEIIGTHHKDGFDFKGKSESQYLAFWNEIVGGEVKKDTNKITVNKKDVWLSETYTPIKDENGNVYKVMKLAFDVSEFVKK
ncbi:MAG: PAS domain-containing protein [Salinivirgaceae bacterium]|nr:PAS domain-containing protein [Salinivirgaceae bacterium]